VIALLRPGKIEQTTARLVLAVGSQAGTEASLKDGYYMIGRHEECQIRPKSRSVSRRHCLLYSMNSQIQVRDLDSSSGTKVNQQRLEGSQWVLLNDGDELRCGKVVFRVRLQSLGEVQDNESGQKMVTSEPWESFDVASMLSDADDAERETRYEQIRSGSDRQASSDTKETLTDLDDFQDVFESDVFESDGVASTDSLEAVESKVIDPALKGLQASTKNVSGSLAEKEAKNKPSRSKSQSPRSRANKTLKAASNPVGVKRSTVSLFADADRTKIMAAAVLAVLVIGFFGYRIYQFSSGPAVRVIQNID
jgi:pSer/pThr/pTyr-binding forkhead associated (FHA) protein